MYLKVKISYQQLHFCAYNQKKKTLIVEECEILMNQKTTWTSFLLQDAMNEAAEKKKKVSHIYNLNVDPQLSGKVVHFVEGSKKIGTKKGENVDIVLVGPRYCSFYLKKSVIFSLVVLMLFHLVDIILSRAYSTKYFQHCCMKFICRNSWLTLDVLEQLIMHTFMYFVYL